MKNAFAIAGLLLTASVFVLALLFCFGAFDCKCPDGECLSRPTPPGIWIDAPRTKNRIELPHRHSSPATP